MERFPSWFQCGCNKAVCVTNLVVAFVDALEGVQEVITVILKDRFLFVQRNFTWTSHDRPHQGILCGGGEPWGNQSTGGHFQSIPER